MARTGHVVYGQRAFNQDAMDAMRGDIVRGLVELITNCDDAYAGREGGIRISIRPTSTVVDDASPKDFPMVVSVSDAATGLTAEEMTDHFGVLGGVNVAFQKAGKGRGLLGRGAKDVAAFGQVRFEAIKNGGFSRFILNDKGDWRMDSEDVPASVEDFARLGLQPGQSGLTAWVFMRTRYKVPSHAQLVAKLKDHAQLRHLLRRREVVLADHRGRDAKKVILEPRPERGDVVKDVEITLPDYGPVRLILRKLPTVITAPLTEHSEHGILITGANATYQNTKFGFEERAEAGSIAGEVVAPQIERLVRSYDEAGPDGAHDDRLNPVRLVTRDRDGLAPTHPFTTALQSAVIRELLPILDALAKTKAARQRPGEHLQQALQAAKFALAMQLRSIIEEIDDVDPAGPGRAPGHVAEIALVPAKLIMHPGEAHTLTLRLAGDEGRPYTVDVQGSGAEDVVEVVDADPEFRPHARLAAVSASIRLKAGTTLGEAKVVVECENLVARADVVVVPLASTPERPVVDLEFERRLYQVAPDRHRNLRLRAPLSMDGELVTVAAVGVGRITASEVELAPHVSGRFCESVVRFAAGAQAGSGSIEADGPNGARALCRIKVEERVPEQGLDLEIHMDPRAHKVRRASVEEHLGTIRVTVYSGHPAMKKLLGPYEERAGKYRDEDTPAARAVMAEVIGLELASFLVEREAARRPELGWDPARVIARQRERGNQIITVAQKALEDS